MRFSVSQTVRNSHGECVDIPWSKDTDAVGVLHSVAAMLSNLDDSTVPASVRTELVSINVTRTDLPRVCWCGAPATYRQSVDPTVTPGAYELTVYGAPEWWLDVCDEHVTSSADRLS